MSHPECLCAAAGGLAINLLNLAELKNVPKDRRPDLTDWLYWLYFLVTPALGAGLAYLYQISNIEMKPLLAANVGASAPLILRSMAAAIPAGVPPNSKSAQAGKKSPSR